MSPKVNSSLMISLVCVVSFLVYCIVGCAIRGLDVRVDEGYMGKPVDLNPALLPPPHPEVDTKKSVNSTEAD
jgi:hypothetical protein